MNEATPMQDIQRSIKGCFIKPNGYRLVVEPDAFHYSGVLHIPDRAKIRPTTGIVVAVPDNGELDEWLGKRVIWGHMSGTAIKFVNKEAWNILMIEEVLGEIDKTDAQLDKEFAPQLGL